jgi:hypothetical protein
VLAFSGMPGDDIEWDELEDFSRSIDDQVSGCFDVRSGKVFCGSKAA